jgi:branched-chain amino acid aminotransferase
MADMIPFDKREGFIWLDGQFVEWKNAKIHVLTHGLHYGSCVFEGERAYNGKIFKTLEHTKRLYKSAEMLGMKMPISEEVFEQAKQNTLKKQNLTDAYIRAFAWRGSEMMAISAQHSTIHIAIAAWYWPSYFSPELKANGLKLDIAEWKRPSPETIPCEAKAAGLYMICTLSKHKAESKGFNDAMMLDYRGRIAEATGANIFFIKDNIIHTPEAGCFLNGITRQTIIKMCKDMGLSVVERAIMPDELSSFEQCFLTGTAAEVTPVGQIAEHHFKVGELTHKIMEAYEKLVIT